MTDEPLASTLKTAMTIKSDSNFRHNKKFIVLRLQKYEYFVKQRTESEVLFFRKGFDIGRECMTVAQIESNDWPDPSSMAIAGCAGMKF